MILLKHSLIANVRNQKPLIALLNHLIATQFIQTQSVDTFAKSLDMQPVQKSKSIDYFAKTFACSQFGKSKSIDNVRTVDFER